MSNAKAFSSLARYLYIDTLVTLTFMLGDWSLLKSMANVESVYEIEDKYVIQYFLRPNISFVSTHPSSMFYVVCYVVYVLRSAFYGLSSYCIGVVRSPFIVPHEMCWFPQNFSCSIVVLTHLLMRFARRSDLNPHCRQKKIINISISVFFYKYFPSFNISFQYILVNSVLAVELISTGGFLTIPDSNHVHDTNAFTYTNANVT